MPTNIHSRHLFFGEKKIEIKTNEGMFKAEG